MDWVSSLPITWTGSGLTGQITVHKGVISKGAEKHPLDGVAARVESGSAAESHLTLGGVLKHGAFSDKARKIKGGESYLVVEGPGFFWSVEVDPKKRKAAVDFAAQVNDTVRKAG